MSAGSSHGAANGQYRGLVGALEWALPDPFTPDQVVIRRDAQAGSRASAQIIVDASHMSGAARTQAFRAFPSASSPRILFPTEMSFRRFTSILHLRVESRLKLAGVRVLSSFPQVVERLSDHIVVATDRESSLSRTIREFSDPSSSALYVTYRDGQPRPTIWGFDNHGAVKTIAKYASGVIDQKALENEHQVITSLNEIPRFSGRVPALYKYEHGHLGSVLVTDAFDGSPGPLRVDASLESWLNDCVIGPEIPVVDSPLLQTMGQQMTEYGGIVETAFQMAYAELDDMTVPMTVVHGDFAPWNIFIRSGIVHVFDWETGVLYGIPEWDKVFYTFRVGLIIRGWSEGHLRKEVGLLAREGSPFYRSSKWRALITLSLVNLLLLEYRFGEITRTARKLESVLADIVSSWWRYRRG